MKHNFAQKWTVSEQSAIQKRYFFYKSPFYFFYEMVTLFLEQLKLRPHAQCFRQFDAKVVRAVGAKKAPAVFAVNAVNKTRTTQKKVLPFWMVSETFLQLIHMVGRYWYIDTIDLTFFKGEKT